MPYTWKNRDAAAKAFNAEWSTVKSVRELTRGLVKTDYSVVESRRSAHRLLNDFLANMEPASDLFHDEQRFPSGFMRSYITNYDSNTEALFISLGSVLSYRTTNQAKDTDAGTGNNRKSDAQTVQVDQGVQDNTKRFEELLRELALLPNADERVWRRSVFEHRINATWTTDDDDDTDDDSGASSSKKGKGKAGKKGDPTP
jgi:hypothetical protein